MLSLIVPSNLYLCGSPDVVHRLNAISFIRVFSDAPWGNVDSIHARAFFARSRFIVPEPESLILFNSETLNNVTTTSKFETLGKISLKLNSDKGL